MSTTEERIIEAAIGEFSEYGFAGARMDRIAKRAKLNKAMIYYHYKNKEKLYESILTIHTDGIFNSVKSVVPEGKADLNQIYALTAKFIEYLNSFKPEFIKIMLGELASGGKYLKKFIFPRLIGPISLMIIENLTREVNKKTIRSVDPYYTYQQIIGSIMFFVIMKVTFEGTELHKILYSGNYVEKFRDNLIDIMKHGIELKENSNE